MDSASSNKCLILAVYGRQQCNMIHNAYMLCLVPLIPTSIVAWNKTKKTRTKKQQRMFERSMDMMSINQWSEADIRSFTALCRLSNLSHLRTMLRERSKAIFHKYFRFIFIQGTLFMPSHFFFDIAPYSTSMSLKIRYFISTHAAVNIMHFKSIDTLCNSLW